MASNEYSRLLDLPAELRVKIYEHVFEDCRIRLPCRNRTRLSAPAILLVNKQVYEEAVDIYYASATFTYVHPGQDIISEALSHLPRARWADLGHIAVDCLESRMTVYGTELTAEQHANFHERLCARLQRQVERLGARKAVVRMEFCGTVSWGQGRDCTQTRYVYGHGSSVHQAC